MTMFYFLSKSLFFFLQPSVWIMGMIFWALIERRPGHKKKLLISALGLFFIFGNNVLFNEVMLASEPEYQEPSAGVFQTAVVLGGYADHNSHGAGIEFFQSVDRVNKALEIYKEGKVNRLLLSSGVYPEGHPEWNEAALTAHWLMDCGVPEKDLLVESKSWNTFQNALFTKLLLDSLGQKGPVLVITSAYHVRRAQACFEKQGLEVQMLAVDHYSHIGPYAIGSFIFPSMRRVLDWEVPIKEQVGFLIYKMQGYL